MTTIPDSFVKFQIRSVKKGLQYTVEGFWPDAEYYFSNSMSVLNIKIPNIKQYEIGASSIPPCVGDGFYSRVLIDEVNDMAKIVFDKHPFLYGGGDKGYPSMIDMAGSGYLVGKFYAWRYIWLNIDVTPIKPNLKLTNTFKFNYVKSKSVASYNTTVDNDDQFHYNNKVVKPGNVISDIYYDTIDGLSNDQGDYLFDFTVWNDQGELKLKYDTTHFPMITDAKLEGNDIVLTSSKRFGRLGYRFNVTKGTNVPGDLGFNLVQDYNSDPMKLGIVAMFNYNDLLDTNNSSVSGLADVWDLLK